MSMVTITVAVLAVLAAIAGSLEAFESGAAIISANAAVLDQDKATDAWALYQARSIKKYMLDIASEASGSSAQGYRDKSASEASGETEAEALAKGEESKRDRDLAASERHERRHHQLIVAATLIEMGIALSSVAIITRKRWPWISAVIVGALGVITAASGYLA